VGCRGGFCGACATVYRLPGDYRLKFALACQTKVEPNMQLAMIPFYPANRSTYRLSELKGEAKEVLDLYPEMLRCLGCNTCTKSCPQDIDVLGYVSAIVRGDIQAAADISFDCIMCGLCVSRCPAELYTPRPCASCGAGSPGGQAQSPPGEEDQARSSCRRAEPSGVEMNSSATPGSAHRAAPDRENMAYPRSVRLPHRCVGVRSIPGATPTKEAQRVPPTLPSFAALHGQCRGSNPTQSRVAGSDSPS
jgi:ferredoxin